MEAHRTENNKQDEPLKGSPFFAPCLPLCAALRNRWNSCRIRQFGANLPRFWAKEKGGVWSKHLPKGTLTDAKNTCRWKADAKLPAEFLKSPQCGDFLPALVKKDWRSFACYDTEKEKIVLGDSGFAKCAGTDAMERKERFYERRIPKTTIYRMAVQGRHSEKRCYINKGRFRKPQCIYRKDH